MYTLDQNFISTGRNTGWYMTIYVGNLLNYKLFTFLLMKPEVVVVDSSKFLFFQPRTQIARRISVNRSCHSAETAAQDACLTVPS